MNSGATTTNNGAVAAGTLPLPPPVTSLLAARIATAHLPPVTQVRVNLGLSDCERAPAAAHAAPAPAPPTPGLAADLTGVRRASVNWIVFSPAGTVHWCPFCESPAERTEPCAAAPHLQHSTVLNHDWLPCSGSCGWPVAARAQFCVTYLCLLYTSPSPRD